MEVKTFLPIINYGVFQFLDFFTSSLIFDSLCLSNGIVPQNMPRPRGADAAGLLLRELELHPPAEEWHRRNMFGGPWSDPEDMGAGDEPSRICSSSDSQDFWLPESCEVYYGARGLWPRKRRLSERDAAFGLNTSMGLGAYLGIMGSRRDVVTALWKTGLEGVWYKVCRTLLVYSFRLYHNIFNFEF